MANKAVRDQASVSFLAERNAGVGGRESLVVCNPDVVAVDVPGRHVERSVDVMARLTMDVHGDGDVTA